MVHILRYFYDFYTVPDVEFKKICKIESTLAFNLDEITTK